MQFIKTLNHKMFLLLNSNPQYNPKFLYKRNALLSTSVLKIENHNHSMQAGRCDQKL